MAHGEGGPVSLCREVLAAAGKQGEMNAGARSVWDLGPHSRWSSSLVKPLRKVPHSHPRRCL